MPTNALYTFQDHCAQRTPVEYARDLAATFLGDLCLKVATRPYRDMFDDTMHAGLKTMARNPHNPPFTEPDDVDFDGVKDQVVAAILANPDADTAAELIVDLVYERVQAARG